jgi:N-acetylglucosaminyl-diphospho-decaprenol L-rhamnosyltransferase
VRLADKQRPTVSVVVVTYQSERYIGPCLSSVYQHAEVSFEAVVVDNASTDQTRRIVADQFRETALIALDENHWYTAAANTGAARTRGDYVLFLNPDAELTPLALPLLLDHLQREAEVAAAGPRLVSPDGEAQPSAFTYPSLMMTWLEFFPHPGRLLDSRVNGRLASLDGQPIAIDHPLGACMLVRRAAWEDVGPFDEHLVHYCEEVDWCMRAQKQGWRIAHVPRAVVVHHGGASTATAPGRSLEQLYQSRERLHRKHRGPAFRAAARFITTLGLRQERRRLRRRMLAGNVSDGTRERLAAIERVLHRSRA